MRINERGISVLEVMVFIAIVLVLIVMVGPLIVNDYRSTRHSMHQSERELINLQLSLFYYANGEYPDRMTEDGWLGEGYGMVLRDYFPEGLPQVCPFGWSWQIDTDTHKISLLGHDGHEAD